MLLVLIMPFYGFSTEHFWAIWLVHLLVTPLFGYLGAMFAEKVIKQEYGPGSIGHLFTVSVFTGALGASATAKILMWLWSLLVVAFS